ncbi:hypothetical protein HYT24_00780 [Candidatus Pacearchaeota archaeon]|nr:hypothetical protein [Candidatus Pacearchaeota archaeon]
MGLERLSTQSRVARGFDPSVLVKFDDRTILDHTYSPERPGIDLDAAYDFVNSARTGVSDWYRERAGSDLPLGPPPKTELVPELKERLYAQDGFKRAVDTLFGGGSYEELKARGALSKQPWHNEITTGETSYTNSNDRVHVNLSPAHSYEMHANREGFVVPARPVSTDGIILTAPDSESDTGYVVLGLRGGGSYVNGIHTVAAGGLSVSKELKEGKETIQQAFERRELVPELGDRVNNVKSIRAIGRVEDWLLGMGSCTYVFQVDTGLSGEEITASWVTAKDAKEHSQLIFIKNNPRSIEEFVADNYKGMVENRTNRTPEERVLLHPGALGLALYSGMSSNDLRSLFKEGMH